MRPVVPVLFRVSSPLLALALLLPAAASAQPAGTITGVVTSQLDDMRLPGAMVSVHSQTDPPVTVSASSDDGGAFTISGLAPGTYEVRAWAAGFDVAAQSGVVVTAGGTVEVVLALPLAVITQEVSVAADLESPAEAATAAREVAVELLNIAPVAGDDFRSLLPVLPGVIRGDDGRLRLAGGRPEQSGLQVGGASVTDPVTGDFGIELPTDAVETLEVVASPFLAEFGRFTSGITRIETRRAANQWSFSANNLIPMPRFRGKSIHGLRTFSPRFIVGGPIIKDRLFVTESVQYELRRTRVPSLPEGEDDREVERLTTFTRADAQLTPGQHLMSSLVTFPRSQRFFNLGTFVREPVTTDFLERGYQLDVALDSVRGAALVETRVTYRHYDVDIVPQDRGAMILTPFEVTGRHFNEQRRDSSSVQVLGALSYGWTERLGEHRFKIGGDVLHARYEGTSTSMDVEVRDAAGVLRELTRFGGPSVQDRNASDIGLFAQDRWRPHDRLLIEAGVRLDRDGALDTWNFSPRVGASFSPWTPGKGVLRGGLGRFVQRTPLGVAEFENFEGRTVTRTAASGTPGETTFVHRREADATPQAIVASLEYDHRLTPNWTMKIGHLRREGHDEFLIEARPDAGVLALVGTGRSRYMETEATFGYQAGERSLYVTYVRARSKADYNTFDRYFGNLRQPIIRGNIFTRTDVDAPNRLLVRGILPVFRKWQLVPLVEIRNGFPFSQVDANQDFVGRQNEAGRFPVLATLDLAVNRELTIRGRRIRVGLRTNQLLNRFTPRDVQQNIDSGAFGSFYNPIERRYGVTFQILP